MSADQILAVFGLLVMPALGWIVGRGGRDYAVAEAYARGADDAIALIAQAEAEGDPWPFEEAPRDNVVRLRDRADCPDCG